MTKIRVTYDLARPLDDAALEGIAKATGTYGIFHVKVAPSMDKVIVEYDASRLKPEHVPGTLHRIGVPVE